MATPEFALAFRVRGVDKPGSEGPVVVEYCYQAQTQAFPAPARSLRLPVQKTPDVPEDDLAQWANVDTFGAYPTGPGDRPRRFNG